MVLTFPTYPPHVTMMPKELGASFKDKRRGRGNKEVVGELKSSFVSQGAASAF